MLEKVEKHYEIERWISPLAKEKLAQDLKLKIATEKVERLIRNPNSKIDYGYSFPALTEVRQSCLEEARRFYKEKGKRPCIADIGAGFGNMTWKLLAAGAKVDVIELQKPTAEELVKRLRQMDAAFWENVSLDDILTVYVGDAVSILEKSTFCEKYDFIWLGNVIHFFTPDEIKKLNQIFQKILKPEGKIFTEMNTLSTFRRMENGVVLQAAIDRAKQKKLECPGFVALNAVTLIDITVDRVVASSLVSAFNGDEMIQHSIPYRTNAYGGGYLGPVKKDDGIEQRLYVNINPFHQYKINRFNQVMTLLDVSSAMSLFSKAGFECSAYCFDRQGHKTSSNEDIVNLAVVLQKSPNLVPHLSASQKGEVKVSNANLSFINSTPQHQLLLEVEERCKGNKSYDSFLKAIQGKEYSLALCKATAAGSLPLVRILLKYKVSLDIDVNKPSKNGNTALDWIKENNKIQSSTKEEIIKILLENKAHSGITVVNIKTSTIS